MGGIFAKTQSDKITTATTTTTATATIERGPLMVELDGWMISLEEKEKKKHNSLKEESEYMSSYRRFSGITGVFYYRLDWAGFFL